MLTATEPREVVLDQIESDSYRQVLARTHPEIARVFESRTQEERAQRLEHLAIGLSTARQGGATIKQRWSH